MDNQEAGIEYLKAAAALQEALDAVIVARRNYKTAQKEYFKSLDHEEEGKG